jgi:hypothetical protein
VRRRLKRATAACAAVAAAAALAASPASAATDPADFDPYHPCLTQITLPNCVNWALDTASRELEVLRALYNDEVQPRLDPQLCKVNYIVTGEEPCPHPVPTL